MQIDILEGKKLFHKKDSGITFKKFRELEATFSELARRIMHVFPRPNFQSHDPSITIIIIPMIA
jgi:hypothetical protein